MIKLKMNNRHRLTKSFNNIIIFTLFITLILSLIGISGNFNTNYLNKNPNTTYNKQKLKTSAVWASINITSYQLNNTRHYHDSTITIEGDLKYNNGTAVQYTEVAIFVDDTLYPLFTDTTDNFGVFQIDFIIPYSFNVYSVSGYKIQVNVTDTSRGKVTKENLLIIFANATSVFDISYYDSPYIPGEYFNVGGFLRYDNLFGSGIPNSQINYYWFNQSYSWPSNSFFTNPSDGSISENMQIPIDAFSNSINLTLNYLGDFPMVNASQITLPNINLFRNYNCIWNTVGNTSEGEQLVISGQLSSYETPSLKLYNRSLRIFYDGSLIDLVNTDHNGNFYYNYRIPAGVGNKTIRIELVNSIGLYLSSSIIVNISPGSTTLPPPGDIPQPFLGFFLVLFPILIGAIAGLAVYGFYYYKKQDKESRVVKLPLESKIINLKILKETGRLEESLSYLFNAIYMELVSAKYGRMRKVNETIRDFAIISVKELKLNPTSVYPFIQKVEEIIYARPFQITEREFYSTIELFSPLYFLLTGYNFTLNF